MAPHRTTAERATDASGPLRRLRVVEFAGIGPGPFAGMLLADMGADVLCIDPPSGPRGGLLAPEQNLARRGRRSVCVDLKQPEAAEVLLRLVSSADALIEGFRPGVAERLGVGPAPCLARNPRLVYGRVTGWGREGPYASHAGHDINFIALAGLLDPIGRKGEAPVPPLNILADLGGGGMLLALGILAGIIEAGDSGRGQVVDTAMIDGASLFTTAIRGMRAAGEWDDERGTNFIDTGSHFYNIYETLDGRYISVGAIEPQFYDALLRRLGLNQDDLPSQMDRSAWPEMKERFASLFRTKTQAEWTAELAGNDTCFAPVLSLAEVPEHQHHVARQSFFSSRGVRQPAPAPRFSRTPACVSGPPPAVGEHTEDALEDWGFNRSEIAALRGVGVIL
jgi:alpha-methylacyl-CoA racemase